MSALFSGVIPAITTPFRSDYSVDHDGITRHVQWLIESGCSAIVPCGSLGEGATLSVDEKVAIVKTVVKATTAPVIPGIASLSTQEAVAFARASADAGAQGLMVLPPYVYCSDWYEMKAHLAAVITATELPCIIYNNPVAYRTDFKPEQIQELAAEFANVKAVKESSTDARRVAAINALLGNKIALGVGVDDCLMEGVAVSAQFWIAGLVNAFPKESVRLFELARAGKREEALAIYRWFLPLLRMDTVPKFVQLIKLVQQEMGWGHERVRAPRLPLNGSEREQCLTELTIALKNRPVI